jgi:uncharacterized protein
MQINTVTWRPTALPLKQSRTINELRSIIIKPIGSFCNLTCKYCFYLDKHSLYEGSASTHKMNEETLEALIQQMFSCTNHPTFTWQGGEPTIMGLDFFRHVIELQKYYAKGRSYQNSLQTHAMLLTPEWGEFLKKEDFLVGISMDGPEHVHDYYRVDAQGRGTFKKVFENTKMLQDHEVNFNILASVSDYSANYPKEIYQFFRDNEFNFMQFSPIVETDPNNPGIALSFSVNAKQYGRFLHKVFRNWRDDFDEEQLKQKTSVRFFDSLLNLYIGRAVDHCALQKNCNVYMVVEHNGDLFSCDFLVSPQTYLGNLHKTRLQDAFNSPNHIAFGEEKANYNKKCQQCRWLKICYGGCVKDRINDPRDQGHNRFCQSYEYFFEHNHAEFIKLARLYLQNY